MPFVLLLTRYFACGMQIKIKSKRRSEEGAEAVEKV